MPKVVSHFIRKSTQIKASFIQNQVVSHLRYTPNIIFRRESQQNDGGFGNMVVSDFQHLNLERKTNRTDYRFKLFKLISSADVNKIEAHLEQHQTAIAHLHYGTDAGIYAPYLKKKKIPAVVSFYGYDCSSFPRRFGGMGKYYLQNRVFKYVDAVLAMSPDMKNDLIQIGCPEEKIIVHYYGTDVTEFQFDRDYPNKSTLRFLIISGLEDKKNHYGIMDAIASANRLSNTPIHLDIVGDGYLKENILAHMEKLQCDKIQFHGPVVYNSAAHHQFMQKADVFIHPSITSEAGDKEGIPGAIVEAMASGLPVLSTYHAGIPHVIEHMSSGFLVGEKNHDELVRAILQLANDAGLREKLGRNAQKRAMTELNLKAKEAELENIYDGFIDG
jgi:colanic acid/amylovoran biosynthesis glycosyltransferase